MATQVSSQEPSTPPKLLLVKGSQHIALRDAIAVDPNLVREALIDSLFDIPLEDSHLHLILAQESIRRAATVKRDTTPYRLGGVLRDCRSNSIDQDALEAKLYKAGGPKAVAAYAAALQDKTKDGRNRTVGIMRVDEHVASLSPQGLISLSKCIDRLGLHPDLRYLLDRVQRTRPRKPRLQHLPGQIRRTKKERSGAASTPKHDQRGDVDKSFSSNEPMASVTSEIPMFSTYSADDLCNLTIPQYQTGFPDPHDLTHFSIPGTFASHFAPDPSSLDFTTGHGFSE